MRGITQIENELRKRPATWLITGVAGFIGSSLLEALLALGQKVVGIDDLSSGYRHNISEVLLHAGSAQRAFRFIDGDVCGLDACLEACDGVDYVLHQAASVSVSRSLREPAEVNRINVGGMINVLLAARDCAVRRVVFASSSAVYGDAVTLPLSEEVVGQPLSPYAVSKWADEKYAEVFSRSHDLETVGLRYFNVFGPRQDPLGGYAAVIPQWIYQMLAGETCRIYGDGETTRDFCAVGDVVQANILAAVAPLPAQHRIYNVGAAQRTSLNQLHSMLARAQPGFDGNGGRFIPTYHHFREGDVRHSQADIRRICTELGYVAVSDLHQALEKTVQWYAARLNLKTLERTA